MSELPAMPGKPTAAKARFSSFKVLSFDIYGTLIDWESGIINHLSALRSRIPDDSAYAHLKHDRLACARAFNEAESQLQAEHPDMRYDRVLHDVYLRLASTWNLPPTTDPSSLESDATSFGDSIGTWTAFPDSVDAMKRLHALGYRLVPLSNVARTPFARTRAGSLAGVDFWRVYTAEDVGSYKPDLRNFHYLLAYLDEDDRAEGGEGITKDQVLHVAQSLFHDHVPAKEMGMSSVWIARDGAGMGDGDGVTKLHDSGKVGYGWRFKTLGEFADEVERERAEEEKNNNKE